MSCFRFRDLEGEVLELDDNFGDGPLLCVGPGYDPGMRVVQLTPTACSDLAAALLDAAGEPKQPSPSEKGQDDWRRVFLEAVNAGMPPADAATAADLYVRGPGNVEGQSRSDGSYVSDCGTGKGLLVRRHHRGDTTFTIRTMGGDTAVRISAESWADLITLQPKPSNA